MDDTTLINGLLAKRVELQSINSELREKIAVVANDIDAVERVLDSLGYQGEAVTTLRAARIVLFYRNELREYLLAELRKAIAPMTARGLAVKLCEVECEACPRAPIFRDRSLFAFRRMVRTSFPR